MADPDASGSLRVLTSYAKDEAAAANLMAAHNFNSEAEQLFSAAMQMAPNTPTVASDYVDFLLSQNQAQRAIAVAQAAAQAYPNDPDLKDLLTRVKSSKIH